MNWKIMFGSNKGLKNYDLNGLKKDWKLWLNQNNFRIDDFSGKKTIDPEIFFWKNDGWALYFRIDKSWMMEIFPGWIWIKVKKWYNWEDTNYDWLGVEVDIHVELKNDWMGFLSFSNSLYFFSHSLFSFFNFSFSCSTCSTWHL